MTSLSGTSGHQCYPHKIVTGRRDRIRTLRQKGGLSGFTKRSESDYDPFGAAHSSTSISAALGFAMASDMGEATGDAIAVIGDGSISAGMAYEALNNAGDLGRRLFVILNDNEMSIAPPVGAMSRYLSGLYQGSPLHTLKDIADGVAAHLPAPLTAGRRTRAGACDRAPEIRDALRASGLHLYRAGRRPRHSPASAGSARGKGAGDGARPDPRGDREGQGLCPAEGADDCYHGVAKFDVKTGAQKKSKPNAPSYTRRLWTDPDETGRDGFAHRRRHGGHAGRHRV
jgi:1-deoxy-D-xylulose-5-phosphate synthase